METNRILELYIAKTNNRKAFPTKRNYLYIPELNLLIGGFNSKNEQKELTAGLLYTILLGYCRRNSGRKTITLNCDGDKTLANTSEGEAYLIKLTGKQKRVLQEKGNRFKNSNLELIIR